MKSMKKMASLVMALLMVMSQLIVANASGAGSHIQPALNVGVYVTGIQISLRAQFTGDKLNGTFELQDENGDVVPLNKTADGEYDMNHGEADPVYEMQTESGDIRISNMIKKAYQVVQKTTQWGYQIAEAQTVIVPNSGDSAYKQVDFINARNLGGDGFRVILQDEDGNRLEGSFAIYDGKTDAVLQVDERDASLASYDVVGTAQSSFTTKGGQALFLAAPFADYKLKQLTTQDGYRVSADVSFSYLPSEMSIVKDIIVVNKKTPEPTMGIAVTLKDSASTLLDGSFEIQDANGDVVLRQKVSDGQYSPVMASPSSGVSVLFTKNGTFLSGSLPEGSYTLIQKSSAEGYAIHATPISFSLGLSDHNKVKQIEVVNEKNVGTLHLWVLEKDSHTPLKDSEVELRAADGVLIATMTTDSAGKATLDNLKPGEYTLRQTAAAPGYSLHLHIVKATVNAAARTEVTIYNVKSDGALQVITTDTEGNALSGAEYQVKDSGGSVIATVTGSDLQQLLPGHYTLEQSKAPLGYEKNTSSYPFEIKESSTTKITVINPKAEGEIEIQVVDILSRVGLVGASVELRDSNGSVVQTLTTGSDGKVQTGKIPTGTYQVQQTAATAGYVVNGKVLSVTLTRAGAIVTIENSKARGELTVQTVDVNDNPITGAVYQVYDAGGTLVMSLSDEEAYELPPGHYTLQQSTAPTGYVLNTKQVPFEIRHNSTAKIKVVNVKDAAKINVQVVDASSQIGLPGAVVEIKNSDGVLVATLTTDASGKAVSEPLPMGHYSAQQVTATAGYNRYTKDIAIALSLGGANVRIENHKNEGKVSVMTVDTEKNPLAGAEYQVKDSGGSVIATITGTTPIVLAPGNYTLAQSKAPAGYIQNDKVTSFVVKAQEHTEITVVNAKAEAILSVLVVDASSQIGLPGAVVEIKNSDGVLVATLTTDASGKAQTGVMALGAYQVKQVTATSGYNCYTHDIAIALQVGGANVTIENSKSAGKVTVITVDGEQKPLSGAKYEVRDSAGNQVAQISSDAPLELPSGHYTLLQVEAPSGYDKYPSTVPFEVKDNTTSEVIVRNDKSTGAPRFRVVDTQGNALSGIAFDVVNSGNQNVAGMTSGAGGMATVPGLAHGNYTLKLRPGSGYSMTQTPYFFVMSATSSLYTVVLEKDKGSIEVIAEDKDGKPDGGKDFILITADGREVVVKLDADGKGAFDKLPPGHYTVKPADSNRTDRYMVTITGSETVVIYAKPNAKNGSLLIVFKDVESQKEIANRKMYLDKVGSDYRAWLTKSGTDKTVVPGYRFVRVAYPQQTVLTDATLTVTYWYTADKNDTTCQCDKNKNCDCNKGGTDCGCKHNGNGMPLQPSFIIPHPIYGLTLDGRPVEPGKNTIVDDAVEEATDSLAVSESTDGSENQPAFLNLPEEDDIAVEDFGAPDDSEPTTDSTQTVYIPQTGDNRVSMAVIIVAGFALMGLSVIILRRHCLH